MPNDPPSEPPPRIPGAASRGPQDHPSLARPVAAVTTRSVFLLQVQEQLEAYRAAPRAEAFAILALDVDRFDLVSDTLGFSAADHLLSTLTQRLTAVLRPSDRVAQLGDDIFAVLINGLAESDHAVVVARRIQAAVQTSCEIEGTLFHVTASAGLALVNMAYPTGEKLVTDALSAARQAHRERPGSLNFYTERLHMKRSEKLALDGELRQALLRGEIHAHFQPLVGLEDGRVHGFEALARWQHPELGNIPPVKFIPIAEENGLINTLGSLMLDLSLEQLARWRVELDPELYMSVNVAAQQLDDPGFPEEVLRRLAQRGLPPACLHLEITESALVSNPSKARAALQQLVDHGIHISLDDFGTGYSAFSSLHEFPIHTLKIDRSLLPVDGTATRQRQLFDSLCTLARSLDLKVVVEGVENKAQAELARQAVGGLGQGYLWARPMAPSDVAPWVQARRN